MDNESINLIEAAIHKLSPNDLAECLYRVSVRMLDDQAELQATWQDSSAGAIWGVFAKGLDATATAAMKQWHNLT